MTNSNNFLSLPASDIGYTEVETRLLVLAFSQKDGEIASQVLRDAQLVCEVCSDVAELVAELDGGAGAILLVEEVLTSVALQLLTDYMGKQPVWSDLPVLILTHHGANSPLLAQFVQRLGNTTLLERPVRTATLISAVRSALRGRRRQYQMRMSQLQLQESEQRLQMLFEHHPDGILVRDLTGRLLSANKALESLLGYSTEELQREPLERLVTMLVLPEHIEQVTRYFLHATQGKATGFRSQLQRKDGTTIEVEAAYVPLIVNGQIKGVQGIARDVTKAKDYERRIEHLATHDVLTGLPNRHLLNDRLHQAIEQGRRTGMHIGILFLDLNRFKQVNDSLGHDKGDLLLKEIGSRLKQAVREADTVARLGGDEFVIVLEDVSSIDVMATVAQTVLDRIAEPVHLAGHELRVSTSIGGSVFPKDGQDVATLLKHADLAMYQAKELGSGCFRFYDHAMNIKVLERLLTESALQRALEKNELRVYYQPRVSVTDRKIVAVEALVRWEHPEKGLIAPVDFIPLAEEIGMIDAIGEWVLRTACEQGRAWQKGGLIPVKVAVNLSAHQLRSPYVAQTVQSVLKDVGLAARFLELEITESGLMQNIEVTHRTLTSIRESGISISIDDFGTGYSSLAHIKRLPIDTLKIDKSFVRDIVQDRDDAAIVGATIAMAEYMNLNVVAEGVTALEQMRFLLAHRCYEMQGYLFSRPLPANEMEVLLRNGICWGPSAVDH